MLFFKSKDGVNFVQLVKIALLHICFIYGDIVIVDLVQKEVFQFLKGERSDRREK